MDNNRTFLYCVMTVCGMIAVITTVTTVSKSKDGREKEKTEQAKERTKQLKSAIKIDSLVMLQNKYTWKSDSINNVGNPCENENR